MTIKFISRKAHGIIDWALVPTLLATPRACGFSNRVTRLYDVMAGGIAGNATFTKYPAGVVKVMSMEKHLMIDKAAGGLFLAAAALLNDEPQGARACMATTGAFLLMNGFCTVSNKKEHAPRKVAFARTAPIERYAEQTHRTSTPPNRTSRK